MAKAAQKLTSNRVIDRIQDRGDVVLKTLTRHGPIYSFNLSPMRIIPREIAERMIGKGVLVAREASEQSFELGPRWGAIHG